MSTEPRAAPPPAGPTLPRWAVKPVRQLTTGELAEALQYLERHRPDDDVLGRALAGEFARRTAAADFADRTATGGTATGGTATGGTATGRVSPPATPASPDASGSRRPGA
ncbi:hypothetical protein ACN3XK_60905 [Actinomadura welshii]